MQQIGDKQFTTYERSNGEAIVQIKVAFTIAFIDFFLRDKKKYSEKEKSFLKREGWEHFKEFAFSAKVFYGNILNDPTFREIFEYELKTPNPRSREAWEEISEEEQERLLGLLDELEKAID